MPKTIVVIGGFVTDLVTVTHRMPDPGETLTFTSFSQHPGGKGANSAVAAYRLSHYKPASISIPTAPSSTPTTSLAVTLRASGPHPATVALPGSTEATGAPGESHSMSQGTTTRLSTGGFVDGDDEEQVHHDLDDDDIQVRMTGALGDDSFADPLLKIMKENGVDVSQVRKVEGQPTGVGVVIVETMYEENRILFYPGANHDLKPEEFETLDSLNGSGGEKPDLLISQMELRYETVEQILRTASKYNVTTLLNPAPAHALGQDVYKMITHLVMNETEAAILADMDFDKMTDETQYGEVTDIFLRRGVPHVVVTLGAKGAYYSTRKGISGLVKAETSVVVKDTTGAGDTFVGAYGVEVVRQMNSGADFDIRKAVEFACKASARVIEHVGCLEPFPWLDQVRSGSGE